MAAASPAYPEIINSLRFAAFLAFLGAPRPLVIDLIGTDDEEGEDRRERADRHEEKDAAIGNEVTTQAHRHGGDDVAGRVERLVTSLAAIEQLVSHDPKRNGTDGRTENARSAANQDLGRHVTDQKVGTSAISNAPAASATIPVVINARLDRRRSTRAPAGVWVRIPAIPPTVRAIPTRCSFHPYPAR